MPCFHVFFVLCSTICIVISHHNSRLTLKPAVFQPIISVHYSVKVSMYLSIAHFSLSTLPHSQLARNVNRHHQSRMRNDFTWKTFNSSSASLTSAHASPIIISPFILRERGQRSGVYAEKKQLNIHEERRRITRWIACVAYDVKLIN